MAHDSPISDCISVTHNGMMHAFDTPEMRVCGRVIRSCKELKGGKISVPHRLPRLGRPSLGGHRRYASHKADNSACLLVDERAAAGAGRQEGREGVIRARVRVCPPSRGIRVRGRGHMPLAPSSWPSQGCHAHALLLSISDSDASTRVVLVTCLCAGGEGSSDASGAERSEMK